MSDIKDLDYYNNWLENSISNGHIKYYEYLDFKNIKEMVHLETSFVLPGRILKLF